jgi:hypothetical protein
LNFISFFIKSWLNRSVMKFILTTLIATVFFLLFIFFAYRSEILRSVIVWVEPKIHIVLLILVATITIWSAIRHWRGKTKPIIKAEIHNKKLKFVLVALLPALAVIMFSLPLFRTWTTGNDNGGICIGGLIPYSDAISYYIGAQHLLYTGELDSWNHRRPINATLLATRLALARHDFRIAMIMQAILLGLSCYWAARAIASNSGVLPSLAFFAILLSFSRVYVQTTFSEGLGLTFGAFAFTVMWYGLHKRKDWMIAVGLILLVSGLNARIGAILILPCILIWACITFKKTRVARLSVAGFIILATLIGFIINVAVFKLYGGESIRQFHGATCLTLYGFAAGGKGWRQAEQDFPEIKAMDDVTMNSYVYDKTFELIKSSPLGFISGIVKSSVRSFAGFPIHFMERVFGIMPYATPIRGNLTFDIIIKLAIMLLLFILLCAGMAKCFWVSRKDLRVSFIISGLLGNILCIPLIFPDGFLRCFATTFPFMAVAVSFGMTFWRTPLESSPICNGDNHKAFSSIVIGTVLIISALFGTAIARHFEYAPLSEIPPNADNEKSVIALIGPGSAYLDILPSSSSTKTFAPIINESDFKANLIGVTDPYFSDSLGPIYQNANAPATLLYVYDIQSSMEAVILGPPNLIGKDWNYVRFSVEQIPGLFKVKNFSFISPNSK